VIAFFNAKRAALRSRRGREESGQRPPDQSAVRSLTRGALSVAGRKIGGSFQHECAGALVKNVHATGLHDTASDGAVGYRDSRLITHFAAPSVRHGLARIITVAQPERTGKLQGAASLISQLARSFTKPCETKLSIRRARAEPAPQRQNPATCFIDPTLPARPNDATTSDSAIFGQVIPNANLICPIGGSQTFRIIFRAYHHFWNGRLGLARRCGKQRNDQSRTGKSPHAASPAFSSLPV